MKKILLGLVVVIVVALAVVYVRLGAIVKSGLEKYGSKMLGAPVKVELVTLSPFSGRGAVRGLVIGNPPGFRSPSAIEARRIAVALDVRSLLGHGRVLIKDVEIEAPRLTVELGKGGTNLQQLERNLDAYAPSDKKEAQKTQGRPFEIARLRVTGAQAEAVVPQLNGGKPLETKVPDLELTGIGAKPGGATAAQAAKEVLHALVAAAVKSAGGPQNLLEQGVERLRGLFGR